MEFKKRHGEWIEIRPTGKGKAHVVKCITMNGKLFREYYLDSETGWKMKTVGMELPEIDIVGAENETKIKATKNN